MEQMPRKLRAQTGRRRRRTFRPVRPTSSFTGSLRLGPHTRRVYLYVYVYKYVYPSSPVSLSCSRVRVRASVYMTLHERTDGPRSTSLSAARAVQNGFEFFSRITPTSLFRFNKTLHVRAPRLPDYPPVNSSIGETHTFVYIYIVKSSRSPCVQPSGKCFLVVLLFLL